MIKGHQLSMVSRVFYIGTLAAMLLIGSGVAATGADAGGGGMGQNPGKTILRRARAAVRSMQTVHQSGQIYTLIKALPGSGQPGGYVKDVIDGDLFVSRPIRNQYQVKETAQAQGNPSFTQVRTQLVEKGIFAQRLGSTEWGCKRSGPTDVPWGASAYSLLMLPGLATKVHDVHYLGTAMVMGVPAFHVRLTYRPKPFLAGVKGDMTADLFISQLRYTLLRYITAAKATADGTVSKYAVEFNFDRYGEKVAIKLPTTCNGIPGY